MLSSNISDSNARSGSAGIDNILERLIEAPTKINPVKVAADSAIAAKKLAHWFISFLCDQICLFKQKYNLILFFIAPIL
jgi:hypothetical protein